MTEAMNTIHLPLPGEAEPMQAGARDTKKSGLPKDPGKARGGLLLKTVPTAVPAASAKRTKGTRGVIGRAPVIPGHTRARRREPYPFIRCGSHTKAGLKNDGGLS